MPSTIHDVARLAGVSSSTVSKYINGGSLRPKNRLKVQQAIEQLDFKPNTVARSLKSNRTYSVGVILPSLSNTFCATVISAFEKELQKNGYGVLLCDCAEDPKAELTCAQFLLDKKVDGIVNMPLSESPEFLPLFQESNIPVVLIDQKPSDCVCDTVLVDNFDASYKAVEHLIKLHHEKIAIICGDQERFTANERLTGYLHALQDYNIPICEEYIHHCNYRAESGYHIVKSLMRLPMPPTAIFATSYDLTLGTVTALNELGLSIGKDISLIGFDGLALSNIIRPHLSMVTQPMEEIGQRAATLLLQRIQGDYSDFPCVERLKTTFITAASVQNMRP